MYQFLEVSEQNLCIFFEFTELMYKQTTQFGTQHAFLFSKNSSPVPKGIIFDFCFPLM
jgi:hypothetical protein